MSDNNYIGVKYNENLPDIFVVYTVNKIEIYQITNDILNPVPLK